MTSSYEFTNRSELDDALDEWPSVALGTLNANVSPLERCAQTVNVYGHDEMFIRKILPVRPGHR